MTLKSEGGTRLTDGGFCDMGAVECVSLFHPICYPSYVLYNQHGLSAEIDQTGQITKQYGWHPQGIWGTSPVYSRTNNSPTETTYSYYLNDHLGTPQQMIGNTGGKQWQASQSAFGETQITKEQETNQLRFAGQYNDLESGLSYNYYRYYDSQIGRYVSSDPIGLGGGLNSYGYAGGSPLNMIDPFGLDTVHSYTTSLIRGYNFVEKNWNGQGDRSACAYYDKLAKENPNCYYFKVAAKICRGNSLQVNFLTGLAISNAWINNKTTISRSKILENIRSKLIFYDEQSRNLGFIDENGCTCGDNIDSYHRKAFNEVGLGEDWYGGNYWPQEWQPYSWMPRNPVPYDPRGDHLVDDFVNRYLTF